MTVDQVIALAASVGTCVAAVLAFLSLRETSQQRKESYRPQLALKSQSIVGTNLNSSSAWSKDDLPEEMSAARAASYTVSLFNIGLGPAKELSLNWSFDSDAFASEINRLAKANGSKRSVTSKAPKFLEIHTKDGDLVIFNLEADLHQKFDFALPYHVEDNGLQPSVPTSFIAVISMLFAEAVPEIQKADAWHSIENLTKATLCITYSDIAGEGYSQLFRAVVRLSALSRPQNGETAKFYATLEFVSAKD